MRTAKGAKTPSESSPMHEPDAELDRLAYAVTGAAIEVDRERGPFKCTVMKSGIERVILST